MVNLVTSAMDAFAESATEITSGVSKNVDISYILLYFHNTFLKIFCLLD